MNSLQLPCGIYDETLPEDLRPLREFSQASDASYSFVYYGSINSTNDTAKSGDYPAETVIIADAQVNGRGRFTRDWYSPPGVNISMSIALRPADDVPAAALSLLNTAASLAVSRALRAETGLDVWPKWPNDVYIGTRKTGGILSESIILGGRVLRLIIGIGINVNTPGFPAGLKDKATSLTLETGMTYSRGQLIASILREFDQCRRCAPGHVISEWTGMSKTIGSYVYVAGQCGIARALNEDGSLVIALENGEAVTSSGITIAPCH
ncbi:biotin--[acetyl-CoA-carboxylase] ligase [Candidatus Magnetominusculus xianensis]|uniref:Bifunctional biotin--[acetyl-CoA-carboxylase] synthetase/biotin operon repressor n=1 Tax=Candidatus Magnetominusculus xianensis TaxID=1748249 RepID=A0ABR5SDQ7_9BACT|nr:biotin--[acetyl-CoA-carboxylase] ligase [Candidatus Magnetominusculus xianensis]KWT78230.1 bifunctional biotin--[acetyl-CoA-carboxylase] synthetase/biotin operon repressor [Candidatus Magnetominusculus xianensis]MBF0402818.1 biotin--[acetyl-CoA-carboxylase] ligase [Nitrospirota bacterium]